MSCWNASNIPAIKTEPRDTSPQPFGIYRAPPELTPSPQPLSPSGVYTHNTPSPYSMASTARAATQGNQQLISPNQQYNAANAGPGGGNSVNANAQPPMDISDYNAFSQQTQQQQQQQYHSNNFGSAGATHWETKFNPAAATANNNLSNLNNTFTMHNLLTPASAASGPGNGTNGGGCWNLAPNHFHSLQHNLQQQQYQQHQAANDAVATNNNGGLANATVTNANNGSNTNNNNNNNNHNNNNNNEHGLSNLLTFDSEQLVRINSEDQQMLRLNSEDLQISNLSIST